jgi:hypothetical protein
MTATSPVVTLNLSDLLNVAYTDGIETALKEFNLSAEAAEHLKAWIEAQENVLAIEEQAREAAKIADAIADLHLAPIFNAAMEAA